MILALLLLIAAPASSADLAPRLECAAVAGRAIPAKAIALPTGGAIIREAVEAGGVCTVTGAIAPVDPQAPEIQFRVVVPTAWNGKSWHLGGGGSNGVIPPVAAFRGIGAPPGAPSLVTQGFALYGGDSGHQSGNSWIPNEESWRNFAYEQLKKTHDAAFEVLRLLFGEAPRVSYFAGTSQGGREALEVVTRYPADYDGVIAAVPLAYFGGLLIDPTVKGQSI